MKKILLLLISFYCVAAMGQNLIAPITISLPANPPANTADWATAMPPVMINAQSKLRNGQVPGEVLESRILVTIKSSGSSICGAYTQQTAPRSNFSTVTKNWNGANVLSLLGKDCILSPGTYELCVQFYNLNPAAGNGVLGEACKTFTIADTKQQSYSPPQNVIPPDGRVFTKEEANQPITLRWTPVLPRPKADVNYKVRIIEVLPGQNKAAAVRTNTPVDVLQVKNQTQMSTKLSKRCNGCDYVWNVEASKTPAQGDIEMLGTSEATSFSIKTDVKNDSTTDTSPPAYSPPQNVTPADGKVFTKEEAKQPIAFRWTPVLPRPKEDVIYKIRVLEIKPGQSKAQTLKENQPIEQAEVKNATQTTFKLAQRSNGLGYVWNVEAVSTERTQQGGSPKSYGTSTATTFFLSQPECHLQFPQNLKDSFIVVCKGSDPATGYIKYNVCTWLYNKNDITANPLTVTNLTSIIAGNTISNVTPVFSFTIPAGGMMPVCFDITAPPAQTHIKVKAFSNFTGTGGDDCTSNPVSDSIPVAPCPCTYCKEDMIVFNGANQITDAGNILTLNNNISIPGIQVKQFKAELIGISYGPQNRNDQCWVCNKEDDQWGNFTGGTFSSPFPSMINGVFPSLPCCGGNSHHTIGWWGTATTINNYPLKLNISLPPASTLSCCPYNISVCVRYTFTDAECRSCSVVKCFSYVRQPQTHQDMGTDANVTELATPADIRN